MSKVFRILVGVVVVNNGSALLLRRSMRETFMPGAWGIPAGKVEFGENMEAAVARELHEESGLDAASISLVGTSLFMSSKGQDDLHNLQVNYLVETTSRDVRLDHSNDKFQWVPINTVGDAGLDEFTTATIRQAISD